MFRPTLGLRMFRQTPRMMRSAPSEDQAGHGVSQRLRKLRNIPAELWPLGVVVLFALAAGGYSISRKFYKDNLRLTRQNRQEDPQSVHGKSEEH